MNPAARAVANVSSVVSSYKISAMAAHHMIQGQDLPFKCKGATVYGHMYLQAGSEAKAKLVRTPAAAMPPDEGTWEGGARIGCCMLAGGALLEGRISVVGPAAENTHSLRRYQFIDMTHA